MSLFDRLHHHRVNHAVLCNTEYHFSDWFIICSKNQLRNVHIMISGNYMHNSDELYIIDMSKSDVHIFYDLMRFGYYVESHTELNATIWELTDNSFKSYLLRRPIKRQRYKNG